MVLGKRCPDCGGFHSVLVSCPAAGSLSPLARLADTQRQADALEDVAIARYRNRGMSRPPRVM